MMADTLITCPHCSSEIALTESLAAPMVATVRQQYEQRLRQKDEEFSQRERQLREREQRAEQTQRDLDARIAQQVGERLQSERARLIDEESRKARLATEAELQGKAREITDLQAVLAARDQKLAEAQQAQAQLIRKQRELDDARRELDLTVEKRVQENLGEIRTAARREAEDNLKLRVMEKDQTIASLQQKIDELKQRAEQGSQQLQGEVQEMDLENLLRARFPFDLIEPVPKGEFGGDVLQRVLGPSGQACGAILWESKRTKNWSDGWLAKLRDDQRAARAEVAILVSQALPKGIDGFDVLEGVWVSSPRVALAVATAMRHSLLEVGLARQAGEGQQTKTELVYQYLVGPRFRQRVEAIVEAFSSMKEDLDRERKAILKQWAKREEQIDRVMSATVGMYGDLQGIAGRTLQEIDGLSLAALDGPKEDE